MVYFQMSRFKKNLDPFVSLFISINPKNLYFASRPWLEVKPLGVYERWGAGVETHFQEIS